MMSGMCNEDFKMGSDFFFSFVFPGSCHVNGSIEPLSFHGISNTLVLFVAFGAGKCVAVFLVFATFCCAGSSCN